MKRPPLSAKDRLFIARHVVRLLEEARLANTEHFPRLGPKIRSTLKSARGAVRNAERFAEGSR